MANKFEKEIAEIKLSEPERETEGTEEIEVMEKAIEVEKEKEVSKEEESGSPKAKKRRRKERGACKEVIEKDRERNGERVEDKKK